eukprot:c28085_g3_i1 orf=708-1838(-)
MSLFIPNATDAFLLPFFVCSVSSRLSELLLQSLHCADSSNIGLKRMFLFVHRDPVSPRTGCSAVKFQTVFVASDVQNAQVTRFVGGGIAIGCAQSHVIADGHSFWHFMNSWSECARDVPISLPPLHMRTALLPASLTLEEAEKFPSPVASGKEFIIKRSTEDLAESVFHFTASTIRKLKNLALQHGLATSFTSFEVLCAHVWKHVTKARQLNGAQKVRCFFLLNTRSRLNPPLPDGYFGNALCRGSALTTAAELVGESLAATAARIHQNIVAYDDGTIRRELEEVEKFDPSMFPKLSKSNEEANQWSVNVASSPRFRVYETDFGWGRPEAVRPAWIRVDGEMVLFAGREGEGSVDVCLGLSPQTMQTLLQDHHFLG